jgi:hypothetical protein
MNFLFLWGLGIFGVKSGLKMQRLWKRACVFKNVLGSKVYNCDDEVIQNFKDDRPVVITLQAGERLEVNQIVELRDDMIGSLSDVAV